MFENGMGKTVEETTTLLAQRRGGVTLRNRRERTVACGQSRQGRSPHRLLGMERGCL